MKISSVLTLLLCLVSVGCAANLTLIDRTDGQEYAGETGGTIGGNGTVTAEIENVSYSGRWIYSASGGGYSLANATAFSGSTTAFASGSGISVSAQGNGLINMRSTPGQFVRCVFTFNSLSNTGLGERLRNDGRQYGLYLKR
jgi:hypothetical protein